MNRALLAAICTVTLALSACDPGQNSRNDQAAEQSATAEPSPTPTPETETVYGAFMCTRFNGQCDTEPNRFLYKDLKDCQEFADTQSNNEMSFECRAKQQPTHEAEMEQNGWSNAQ